MGAEVLMLGITFKENCPDVRNTKIVDVIGALDSYGVKVSIYDPWAKPAEVKHEYKLDMTTEFPTTKFDGVVLGVAHKEFLAMDLDSVRKGTSVLYDVKGILENASGSL